MPRTPCIAHHNPFASPQFQTSTAHILLLFVIPISFYGTYCILFKTPRQMNSVKFLMLNLHVWASLSDFTFTFLGIPYILLPEMAGYTLGVVDNPRLVLYLCATLISACAASVVIIYENRFFALFARRTSWRKFRKPVLSFLTILVPLIFIPPYFFIPNQELARSSVHEALPCFQELPKQKLFVLSITWYLPTACLTFGTVLWTVLIATFEILTFVKLWRGSHHSIRTIKLQKKFALAVTVQASFMFIMLFTPCFIFLSIIFSRYHDQALNNITLLILSIHGSSSTLVMVSVHKPYREFTISNFCFWKAKKSIRICENCHHEFKSNAPVSVVF